MSDYEQSLRVFRFVFFVFLFLPASLLLGATSSVILLLLLLPLLPGEYLPVTCIFVGSSSTYYSSSRTGEPLPRKQSFDSQYFVFHVFPASLSIKAISSMFLFMLLPVLPCESFPRSTLCCVFSPYLLLCLLLRCESLPRKSVVFVSCSSSSFSSWRVSS